MGAVYVVPNLKGGFHMPVQAKKRFTALVISVIITLAAVAPALADGLIGGG